MGSRCRLLGGAIEVHDTSPELYKSGSLTVADISSALDESSCLVRDNAQDGSIGIVPCYSFNAPPATLAEATVLPGSQTWEAKEGVYAVLKQSKRENPFEVTQYGSPLWVDSVPTGGQFSTPAQRGVGTPPEFQTYSTNPGPGVATYLVPFGIPVQPTPFDIKVILLSGLDPNGSYRVNFNIILEAIPDITDQRLLVLAKPSPRLDMNALELYSETIRELPSGVPVRMNSSGEWFSKVLGVLDKFAAPIGNTLGALGVPFAATIGNGVSKAAGLGKDLVDKKLAAKAKKAPAAIAAQPKKAK